MPNAELNIVARMTDLASAQIMRLRGEVWMLSRVTDQSTGTITRYDKALSGLMAGGILMSLSRGVFGFVEANNELNDTLTRTRNNTIMASEAAGHVATSFEDYRQAIMNISTATGQGAEQIAEGFQHAYNYADDFTVAISQTTVATKSARANYADTEATVNLLSNVMHQFGADVLPEYSSETDKASEATKRAAYYMGLLDRAAAMGNMTVEEFVQAAGRSYAAAARAGVSILDASAAYVTLTKRGFNAAQAQTQLTNIITRMQNPTKEQAKYIRDLSKATGIDLVSAFSAAGLSQNGLMKTVDMLRAAYQKLGYNQAEATQMAYKLINAQRGGQGLAVLITNGYEDMREAVRTLGDETAMAAVNEEQFAEASERLSFNLQTLLTIVSNVVKSIGNGMSPILNEITKVVIPLAKGIYQVVSQNEALAGVIATVVGAGAGLLGLLLTLGATALLLGPIFKAGAVALGSFGESSNEATAGMQRQIQVASALEASERRIAIAAEATAAAERARVLASRAGVETMRLLQVGASGMERTYKSLLATTSALGSAFRLKVKEIKGLTQAEIEEQAIAKARLARIAAEKTATELSVAAEKERNIVVAARVERTRLLAQKEKDLATATIAGAKAAEQAAIASSSRALALVVAKTDLAAAAKLTAQADEAEAKAAVYAAQAADAEARAKQVGVLATKEKTVASRAATAAGKIETAQLTAQAGVEKILEAETNTLLTAEQRRAKLQEGLALLNKSRVQTIDAEVASNKAAAASTSLVSKAYALLKKSLFSSVAVAQVYSKAQTQLNATQSVAARIGQTLTAATSRLGLVMGAVGAAIQRATATVAAYTLTLKGVQIATFNVSAAVYSLYRTFMVTQAVVRTIGGVFLGLTRTLITLTSALIRTASVGLRAMEALASAALAAGRAIGSAAQAVWTFVTAGRAGTRTAQEQALAMRGLGESALLTGDAFGKAATKSGGLLSFLGGLAGKLLGLGLTAMIVYDMWSQNFLGLKDLTAKIFGGYIEDVDSVIEANDRIGDSTKKAAAALSKIPANAGPAGKTIDKLGRAIVTTFDEVNGVWYRTIKTFDRGGKLIGQTIERVTEKINEDGSKTRTYVKDLGDQWETTVDSFDKNGKKISTTITRTKKDTQETSDAVGKALKKVQGVVGDVTNYVGARFVELMGTLGKVRDFISGLFAGGTWETLKRFANTLDSVFGPGTGDAMLGAFFSIRDALDGLWKTGQKVLGGLKLMLDDLFRGDVLGILVHFGDVIGALFGNDAAENYWRGLVEVWKDVSVAVGKVLGWFGKLARAIGKLIRTGDLKGFFDEMMPTQAEWKEIFKTAADLAGRALKAAFNLKDAIKDVLGRVWKALFGGKERGTDAGMKDAEVWADGIFQEALKALKKTWDEDIAPTLGGVVADVYKWLFGGEETDESGLKNWAPGIFQRAYEALKTEWEVNVSPKLGTLVSNVWSYLFGGEIKDEKGKVAGWANGVISEGWNKLKDKWNNDWGPRARDILSNVWTYLFGGEVPSDNGSGKVWSEGLVGKIWAVLGRAFETVKPLAIDLWTILFGGTRTEMGRNGKDQTTQVEGLIPQLLKGLNQAMLSLAADINKSQDLKDKSAAAGEALVKVIVGGIKGFFDDGGGNNGFIQLGKAVAGTFIGPFFEGMAKGITGGPTDFGSVVNTILGGINSMLDSLIVSIQVDEATKKKCEDAGRAFATTFWPNFLKGVVDTGSAAAKGQAGGGQKSLGENILDFMLNIYYLQTAAYKIAWDIGSSFVKGFVESIESQMRQAIVRVIAALPGSGPAAKVYKMAIAGLIGGPELAKEVSDQIDKNMVEPGKKIPEAMAEGVEQGKPTVKSAAYWTMMDIIAASDDVALKNAVGIGWTFVDAMTKGTVENSSTFISEAEDTVIRANAAAAAQAATGGSSTGQTFVVSVADQILAMQGDVVGATTTVVDAASSTSTQNAVVGGQRAGQAYDSAAIQKILDGESNVSVAMVRMIDQASENARKSGYSDGKTIGQRISDGIAAGLSLAFAQLRALRIQIDQITNYKKENGGYFAAGGRVTESGMYKVGERGPEYVRLPVGALVRNATQTRADDRRMPANSGPAYYFNLTQNIQGSPPTPIQGFQALRAWANA